GFAAQRRTPGSGMEPLRGSQNSFAPQRDLAEAFGYCFFPYFARSSFTRARALSSSCSTPSLHPLQQMKTGSPLTANLTGTPIDPSRLSDASTQNRCCSASARSSDESWSRFALIFASFGSFGPPAESPDSFDSLQPAAARTTAANRTVNRFMMTLLVTSSG